VLQKAGVDHDVVLYLRAMPDRATLEDLLTKLEDSPADLIRRDKFFTDVIVGKDGLDPETLSDPQVVIDLLVAHPRLLQRPVVIKGEKAVIGRPRDRVPALIES
jgi:arsenate reductase